MGWGISEEALRFRGFSLSLVLTGSFFDEFVVNLLGSALEGRSVDLIDELSLCGSAFEFVPGFDAGASFLGSAFDMLDFASEVFLLALAVRALSLMLSFSRDLLGSGLVSFCGGAGPPFVLVGTNAFCEMLAGSLPMDPSRFAKDMLLDDDEKRLSSNN